jgi:hypothetical protein
MCAPRDVRAGPSRENGDADGDASDSLAVAVQINFQCTQRMTKPSLPRPPRAADTKRGLFVAENRQRARARPEEGGGQCLRLSLSGMAWREQRAE